MKKALIVCMVILAMLAVSMTVSAAEAGDVVMSGPANVDPGEKAVFTVTVDCDENVCDCMVEIDFDERCFELEGIEWLVSGGETSSGGRGYSSVTAWDAPVSIDGDVLRFTLVAKRSVIAGTKTEVSCSVSASGEDGETPVDLDDLSAVEVTIGCKHTTYVHKEEARYLRLAGDCQKPAEYYVSCADCGEKGDEIFESKQPGAHQFERKAEEEAYLVSAGDCKTGATYYYSCTVCHEKGQETFVSETGGVHKFDGMREEDEYLDKPGDCQTRVQYFYCCSLCGAKGEQTFVSGRLGEHQFDNACDDVCNVCLRPTRTPMHTPSETWSADETGHYHACSVCGEKVDLQPHVPGPEPTVDEPQICTVCEFVLAVSDEHEHKYSSEWTSDEKTHWHKCICGTIQGLQPHSWVRLDQDSEDEVTMKCEVCNFVKKEQITDPTEPETQPVPPTTQPVVVAPQEEEDPVNVAAIILGILLAVSVAVNVVLTVLLLKKNDSRR